MEYTWPDLLFEFEDLSWLLFSVTTLLDEGVFCDAVFYDGVFSCNTDDLSDGFSEEMD